MRNLKLKEFLCNRQFDVNCKYRVYHGIWVENEAEPVWDSAKDGELSEDDDIANYNITYVTVNKNILIIEIG